MAAIYIKNNNGKFIEYRMGELFVWGTMSDHAPTPEVLNSQGYYLPITPDFDHATHRLLGGDDPYEDIAGVTNLAVVPLTADEIDQIAADLAVEIACSRVSYRSMIDSEIGRIRTNYVTAAPGQDATYAQKIEDAEEYISAGYPADPIGADPTKPLYPYIVAEHNALLVKSPSATYADAADFILYQKEQMSYLGAYLEDKRRTCKETLDLCLTVVAMQEVYDNTIAQVAHL